MAHGSWHTDACARRLIAYIGVYAMSIGVHAMSIGVYAMSIGVHAMSYGAHHMCHSAMSLIALPSYGT